MLHVYTLFLLRPPRQQQCTYYTTTLQPMGLGGHGRKPRGVILYPLQGFSLGSISNAMRSLSTNSTPSEVRTYGNCVTNQSPSRSTRTFAAKIRSNEITSSICLFLQIKLSIRKSIICSVRYCTYRPVSEIHRTLVKVSSSTD